MFFALGILVAGLLGLMILPALWWRAVRLSTRRLAMQVPLSMDEVLAERDLLRAEFALVQNRLEKLLERERYLRAQERIALGGARVELLSREESLAELHQALVERDEALVRERVALVETQAQLGAAHLLLDDRSAASAQISALQGQVQDLLQKIAERDARLAGCEVTARETSGAI